MKIQSLDIKNIRSIERFNAPLIFSPRFNIFVGHNNSGKSTLVRSLLIFQKGLTFFSNNSIRDKSKTGQVAIEFNQADNEEILGIPHFIKISIKLPLSKTSQLKEYEFDAVVAPNTPKEHELLSHKRPDNLYFARLSIRRNSTFDTNIGNANSKMIIGTNQNLPSQVDEISNNKILRNEFESATREILGIDFQATPSDSHSGKDISYQETLFSNYIHILEMGEGCQQVIAIILDILNAKNQIIVIEEIENDLHPQALKKLLDWMIIKAEENNLQFFLTTHSHIVLQKLFALRDPKKDTKVWETTITFDGIPTTTVQEINEVKILGTLERLGYSLQDYFLFSAWIILEESSAEKILNDIIIPNFVQVLKGKVRTIASGGAGQVEKRVRALTEFFIYAHLSGEVYQGKSWIIIDGGKNDEKTIIDKLREKYVKEENKWTNDNFSQWSQHKFESYYPDEFKNETKIQSLLTKISTETNSLEKSKLKGRLAEEAVNWTLVDKGKRLKLWEQSASEIITKLTKIAEKIS